MLIKYNFVIFDTVIPRANLLLWLKSYFVRSSSYEWGFKYLLVSLIVRLTKHCGCNFSLSQVLPPPYTG